MVRQATAMFVEEGVPVAQGLDVVVEIGDLHIAQFFELVDEDIDSLQRRAVLRLDGHRLVRPPGSVDLDLEVVPPNPLVVLQRIKRAFCVQTSLTFILRMMLRTLNSSERSMSLHVR